MISQKPFFINLINILILLMLHINHISQRCKKGEIVKTSQKIHRNPKLRQGNIQSVLHSTSNVLSRSLCFKSFVCSSGRSL